MLQEYPEARAMLEERGRKTLVRDGTLDETEALVRLIIIMCYYN